MNRRTAAVLFASMFAACGDGGSTTATASPDAAFAEVVADCRAEHRRLEAILGDPNFRTIAPVATFGPRATALAGLLADADATANAPVETAEVVRRRIVEEGRTLIGTRRLVVPLLELLEDVRDPLRKAVERRASFDAPIAALKRFGPAPAELRVATWTEALRTAEDALRRASRKLADEPNAAAATAQDVSIAKGGLDAAVRNGESLYVELADAARGAIELSARRDATLARLTWAKATIEKATLGGADASGLADVVDAAEKRLDALKAAFDAATAAYAACATDAAARAALVAAELDAIVVDATAPALELARKAGLPGPP